MNQNTESFAPFFEKAQQSETFWERLKILEFSELVAQRLEAAGMTNSDLAEKMNVSRAYITKLMAGSNNFTIRSMVRVASALGSELYIDLKQSRRLFVPVAFYESARETSGLETVDNEGLALAA